MDNKNKGFQRRREIARKYKNTINQLLNDIAMIWLNDPYKAHDNELDRHKNRKRCEISTSEDGTSYSLYIWYGNGTYLPHIGIDMDDFAWFLKTTVIKYSAVINIGISYLDNSRYAVSRISCN